MTLFDKTLYLQRLIYAADQSSARWRGDKYEADCILALKKLAEQELDDSIESLHQVLEIMGSLPKIGEA